MKIDDFYALLGVARNTDLDAIKSRYRVLCKQYHPDTNPNGTEADKRMFHRMCDACDILKDSAKREQYDRELRASEIKTQNTVAPRQTTPVPDLSGILWGGTIAIGIGQAIAALSFGNKSK